MDEINKARMLRSSIYSAAEYYLLNIQALNNDSSVLEWDDLKQLPDWCLWDEKSIQQLVMIAGTVFLLPTIRLWIEAKKIQKIHKLITKPVFEFIMEYTNVENSTVKYIDMDDLRSVIQGAGASVLLSSQKSRLQPWLVTKLPTAKGKINRRVAKELLNHSVFILRTNHNKISQEKDNTEVLTQSRNTEDVN